MECDGPAGKRRRCGAVVPGRADSDGPRARSIPGQAMELRALSRREVLSCGFVFPRRDILALGGGGPLQEIGLLGSCELAGSNHERVAAFSSHRSPKVPSRKSYRSVRWK